MRKRKRKGNIVSVEKEDDTMEAIQPSLQRRNDDTKVGKNAR